MFWKNNYTYIHNTQIPNRKIFCNFILHYQFLILYYLPLFRASGHIFSNYYYPSKQLLDKVNFFIQDNMITLHNTDMLCGTQTYAIWWHRGLTVGGPLHSHPVWMGQCKEPMVRFPFGDDSFQAPLPFPHTSVLWECTS